MLSGKFVPLLSEASHVLFEGTLNDPSFREIASQRIKALAADSVTLERSGLLKIEIKAGRQFVVTSFACPIFGKQKTIGRPFKDSNTAAITSSNPPAHA